MTELENDADVCATYVMFLIYSTGGCFSFSFATMDSPVWYAVVRGGIAHAQHQA